MAGRFGERTRVTEAVSGFGQRSSAGGGTWVMTETVFNAPGTWTCPPTVTSVEVVVVGGGGGGGFSTINGLAGGGGGGGIRTAIVPVSSPVPVTVGAGGAGGRFGPSPTNPLASTNANPGGTSGFGPLGPGPVPTIPPTTIAVGGGGAGVSYIPAPATPTVPPIGGGGGGVTAQTFEPVAVAAFAGGRYGYPSTSLGSSASSYVRNTGAGGAGGQSIGLMGGAGKFGYGGGAPSTSAGGGGQDGAGTPANHNPATDYSTVGRIPATAGKANTGGGGGAGTGGNPAPFPTPAPLNPQPALYNMVDGQPGGSGVVIVRHWSAP